MTNQDRQIRHSRDGNPPFTRDAGATSQQLTAVDAGATAATWPLTGGFLRGINA